MIRRKEEDGFTLVELMVVLVIMGIGFGMAYPSFSHFLAENRLNSAARELAGEIRLVQQRAISGEVGVKIHFVPAAAGYENYYLLLKNIITENKIELPKGVSFQSVYLNDGNSQTVSFGANGQPLASGNIRLTGDYGMIYAVIIKPATGRVRVEKVQ